MRVDRVTSHKYDAFISYRRADGRRYAVALRRALLDFRFPRSFDDEPRRRLAVYLDTIYERATNDFFEQTIQPALRASAHLIVVRTPGALQARADGQPNWVEREIEYFRGLPQRDQISAAVAIGAIGDPLPANLSGRLRNIEVVDIRRILRPWISSSDEVLKFIATLYEIPPERMPELRAEQQKRRASRLRWLATGALILAIAMSALAGLALWSRQLARDSEARAVESRRIAVARQLAAESAVTRLEIGREIERSVLLAIQSYRREPTPEGEQALRGATPLLLPRVAAFEDQTAETFTSAMRPDAAGYALAAFGAYVTLHDAATGRVTGTFPVELEARSLAFSPNSSILAVRSPGGVVTIWSATGDLHDLAARLRQNERTRKTGIRELDVAPAERVAMLRKASGFRCACTVPDDDASIAVTNGGIVAAAHENGVTVVDCSSRRTLVVLPAKRPSTLAFDFAGARLITGAWDGALDVWNVASGARLRHFDHEGIVDATVLSADGRFAVTSGEDRTARLWEIESGRERLRIQHPRSVRSVAISDDGSLMATGCDDLAIRVFETMRGREVARIPEHGSSLTIGFTPSAQTLVACDFGGSTSIWDLRALSSEARRVQLGERVMQLAPWKDGVLAVVAGGRLAVINPATGRVVHTIGGSAFGVSGVSADASVATVTTRRTRFSLTYSTVRLRDGSVRQWAEEPLAVAAGMIAVRSGRSVVVARIADGKELMRWPVDILPKAAAFSRDGSIVAVTDGDSIDIRSVTKRRPIRTIRPSRVGTIAVSDDGKWIAAEERNNMVIVRDVTTGRRAAVIDHDDAVEAIAFSPDDGVILTAGFDRVAKISACEGGRLLARLPHDERVISATFDRSGDRAITGTFDGEVTVWTWRPELLIARGCTAVTRDLTPEEWRRSVGDEPQVATCR